MTEDRNAIERLVLHAGWVDTPDDLRGRVVTAAAAAVGRSLRAGWFDRVWYSTGWRVATAVALLALALLNGIAANAHTDAADDFGMRAYEAADDARQAARHLGWPEADCQQLAALALAAAIRSAPAEGLDGKE